MNMLYSLTLDFVCMITHSSRFDASLCMIFHFLESNHFSLALSKPFTHTGSFFLYLIPLPFPLVTHSLSVSLSLYLSSSPLPACHTFSPLARPTHAHPQVSDLLKLKADLQRELDAATATIGAQQENVALLQQRVAELDKEKAQVRFQCEFSCFCFC